MNSTDKIYAKALIDMTNDGKIFRSDLLRELDSVSSVLAASKDLFDILQSPAVSSDKKVLILEDIFKGNINPELLNFLKLLAEKNRFDSFNDILSAFSVLADELDGIKRVTVISAIELSEDLKNELISKLSSKLSMKIVPEWTVDENIVGGLVIKYDDNVIDTSVKSKLNKIAKGNL